MSATITTGDDGSLVITLTKNGTTFVINSAAVVKAAITDLERTKILVATVTCASDASGADWDNSVVVATFPRDSTGGTTDFGEALVAVMVDYDNERLTWWIDGIDIVNGLIS